MSLRANAASLRMLSCRSHPGRTTACSPGMGSSCTNDLPTAVPVVDTTGAGDIFHAGFIYGLAAELAAGTPTRLRLRRRRHSIAPRQEPEAACNPSRPSRTTVATGVRSPSPPTPTATAGFRLADDPRPIGQSPFLWQPSSTLPTGPPLCHPERSRAGLCGSRARAGNLRSGDTPGPLRHPEQLTSRASCREE